MNQYLVASGVAIALMVAVVSFAVYVNYDCERNGGHMVPTGTYSMVMVGKVFVPMANQRCEGGRYEN